MVKFVPGRIILSKSESDVMNPVAPERVVRAIGKLASRYTGETIVVPLV